MTMELHNFQQICRTEDAKTIRKRTNAVLVPYHGRFSRYVKHSEYSSLSKSGLLRSQKLREAILKEDFEQIRKFLITQEDYAIDGLDVRGMAAIHYAAKHGLLAVICLLVVHRATLDLKTRDGSTALHIAIRHRKDEVAKFLLKQGSNPYLVDENGLNALLLAAKKGLSGVVANMLEIKAVDPNVQDQKLNTALHFAAILNDTVTCEILLENGAKVESTKGDGETPLHLAVAEKNIEIIEIILDSIDERKDSSISVCDYINRKRHDTCTSLHLAVQKGDLEITNILIKNGADTAAQTKDGLSALHFAASASNGDVLKRLLGDGLKVDTRDNHKRTALHWALQSGQMEAAHVLLRNNADVNAKDEKGLTPLLLAVVNNQVGVIPDLLKLGASPATQDLTLKNSLHYAAESGNTEAAKLLIEATRSILHDVDEENRTPIHYAAGFGHAKILDLFMSHTMRLDETDIYGNTPLHLAAQFGNISCINLLTKDYLYGLINYANMERHTPLHVAVIYQQLEACKSLLSRGANVNCQDRHRWTPLHYASAQEKTEIMQILLETDVNINMQDDYSTTPLMVSAEKGNAENVMMLLESGADINLCDFDGNSFFDLAIDYRRDEVCKAVLESDRWDEVLSSKDKHGCHFMEKLIQMCPVEAEIVLDRCTTFSDHHPKHPEFAVTYNFKFLECDPQSTTALSAAASIVKERRSELYFAPSIMAENGRERLMAHPVTSSLFKVKWKRLCRYAYYLSFLVYVVFIVALSILAMVGGRIYVAILEKRAEVNITTAATDHKIKELFGKLPSSTGFGNIFGYFILVFCGLQVAKELMQIVVFRWRYFLSLTNYIELVLYGGTLYFIIQFNLHPRINATLYELGIVCVFLGWSNTLLFLQRIPLYRLYIVMFLKVCFTIVKLLVVFGIIIQAFAMTFYLLFIRQKSFRTLYISVPKVLVMMTGEFNFDESITSKLGEKDATKQLYVPYPTLSYLIFIIFVFLVAVAFTNLLIGLAVGDIESVRKLATVSIFEQQLEFIDTLQGIMPRHFLKRFVYVENETVLVNKLTRWQRFMSTITSDTTSEDLKRLRAKQIEFETQKINRRQEREYDARDASRRTSVLEEFVEKQRTMFTKDKIQDATVICNEGGF